MKHCTTCQHLFHDALQVCPTDNMSLRLVRELEPGMIVRNKYIILEWIGAGGMAAVYRAKHRLLNEMRAIKVVSAKFAGDEDFLKRFRHEAAIARRLRHENAVWVEDLDEIEDGRPFIAMEFLQGDDLRKLIKEQGPLAVERSLKLGSQVTSALSAAHKLGIIHRDIKPDNIFIARDDAGNERAKVLDFGIAKAKEGALQSAYTATKTGVIIGTPEYMSPEQAEGQLGDKLDGRSDLYSLGVVLYEMLTGKLPFESDTPLGMCLHHLQTIPRPPHQLRPDLHIPEAVSALLMKALEKRRERRFQSAQEMLAALRNPSEWARTAQNGAGAFAPTKVVHQSGRSGDDQTTTALGPSTAAAAALQRSTPATQERALNFSGPAVAARQKENRSQYHAPHAEGRRWRILIAAMVVVVCVMAGYLLVKTTQRRNEALQNHNLILQNLIVQKIRSSPSLPGKDINVTVESDVATLSGNVPLPNDKDAAANLARSVDGISSVVNDIEVVGAATPESRPPGSNNPAGTPSTPSQTQTQAQLPAQLQPTQSKTRRAVNLARANELVKLGNGELDKGNYAAAINDFQKAVRLDPTNSVAQNGITRAKAAQKVEEEVLKRRE